MCSAIEPLKVIYTFAYSYRFLYSIRSKLTNALAIGEFGGSCFEKAMSFVPLFYRCNCCFVFYKNVLSASALCAHSYSLSGERAKYVSESIKERVGYRHQMCVSVRMVDGGATFEKWMRHWIRCSCKSNNNYYFVKSQHFSVPLKPFDWWILNTKCAIYWFHLWSIYRDAHEQ